ncbi:MAG TPA: hypothetical protein DEA08_29890, partial [Planctomycetes bacterium]|nr:hypothetical protein [Planctomycetota bacterium]
MGLQEGTVLGGSFRLGRHVERSRRGEVYLAVEQESGTPCRAEVIAASGYSAEELREALAREVAVGQRLRFAESALRALGLGRLDPEHLFVVRATREGLRPFDLSSGSLEERAARLAQLASRLEAIHQAGVVHRDLCMLTAQLDSQNQVWLSDFGLALAEGVGEPPLDARGPGFRFLPCVAPEVLESLDHADPRADVFSLGVLLHVALCGQPPYPGPTLVDLVRQHDVVRRKVAALPGPVALEPAVPDDLSDLARRAAAVDPSDRPPSVAAFRAELLDCLQRAAALSPGAHTPVPTPAAPSGASGQLLPDPFASDMGAIPPDLRGAAPLAPLSSDSEGQTWVDDADSDDTSWVGNDSEASWVDAEEEDDDEEGSEGDDGAQGTPEAGPSEFGLGDEALSPAEALAMIEADRGQRAPTPTRAPAAAPAAPAAAA